MSRSLPHSKASDRSGLRVARWVRESTGRQFDRYGPASQHREMDAWVERFGVIDTGIVYTAAASGTTVWQHTEMERAMGDAGRQWDLLLTGYSDRWQRNVRRTLELVEDRLHPSGAAWVMCDRDLVSSIPGDWREMRRLAADAQDYSERLGERITDGYGAKWERHSDQAGSPPLGFRRAPDPPQVLEIDPEPMRMVVELFERYATGTVSDADLAAEHGLGEEQVRKALRNQVYVGFVQRHRGRADAERRAAPWRSAPPVSDELFDKVQQVRYDRRQGGGPRRSDRFDPLRTVLFCTCGTRIRSDGSKGTPPRFMKMHPNPCTRWGAKARRSASFFEDPVLAQLKGIELSDITIEKVIRVLSVSAGPNVLPMAPRQRERELERLAKEFASGTLSAQDFIERTGAIHTIEEPDPVTPTTVTAERAVHWLLNLSATVALATPTLLTELVAAVYERIEVHHDEFVGVTLTPTAMAHGLALALPERVHWRPRQGSGAHTRTTLIPVLGRIEWLDAAGRRTA